VRRREVSALVDAAIANVERLDSHRDAVIPRCFERLVRKGTG
jgi:hypothetical protein